MTEPRPPSIDARRESASRKYARRVMTFVRVHRPPIVWASLTIVAVSASIVVVTLRTVPLSILPALETHQLRFVGGGTSLTLAGHGSGLLASQDGARTWAPVEGISADTLGLVVTGPDRRTIYLGGHGVFKKSTDGGITWSDVETTLSEPDLHWLDVNPDDPDRLYAQVAAAGLLRSENGGRDWSPWLLEVPAGVTFTALGVIGGVPENVLGGAADGTLLYSHDGGLTWERIARFSSGITALALNYDALTLYLGTNEGVYRSSDGGVSWAPLPLKVSVRALAAGGKLAEAVLVSDREQKIFRLETRDGKSWKTR